MSGHQAHLQGQQVIEATQAWAGQQLHPAFAPFVARWRDHTHAQAGPGHAALHINHHAMGQLHGPQAPAWHQALLASGLVVQASGQPGTLPVLHLQGEPKQLAAQLNALGEQLRAKGLLKGWRNEQQTALNLQGQAVLNLERALFKPLGLCSQAVHVHAHSPDGWVWLGQRALTKSENPGLLDNLAAGGMGVDEAPLPCAHRELLEEAGMPAELSQLAKPVGPVLRMNRPIAWGWHHELVYMLRVQVPADWTPRNTDGEVAGFHLLPAKACAQAVNDWRLTPDAALVTAWMLSQQHPTGL